MIEKVGLHEVPLCHYLLLHYWTKAFGISEFSTRILSVIFGVLSIVMMFLLGNLLFGEKDRLSLFPAVSDIDAAGAFFPGDEALCDVHIPFLAGDLSIHQDLSK